jgi:hypothetical protein
MKLSEGIERYVACKRQGGLLYTATEYGLTSFKKKVGDVELNEVTSDDVLIISAVQGPLRLVGGKNISKCRNSLSIAPIGAI